jgi:hypothetical protein
MLIIDNKVFKATIFLYEESIFICKFSINKEFQGRRLSYMIFKYLSLKYKRSISLDCWPTLFDYYTKLGFIKTGESNDGYYEMELTKTKNGKYRKFTR